MPALLFKTTGRNLRRVLSGCGKAILPLASVLSLAALGTPRAAGQSQSGFTYNGVVYTSYQATEYANSQGPQGTAAIRATGASYAAVMVTQYVQTYTSTTIAPETASTPGYNSQTDSLTPTDAAVTTAIKNLQAQGLTVVMKPQVDSLDRIFRGSFAPTDAAAWFASYQTFILHYAALASQNNVGYLIIGTELKSLSGASYVSYWDNIIAQLRTSYPSLTLVYGANATGGGDEFSTVSFWDKVDIIGVDGYFPLTNHADPTVAQLVSAWTSNKSGFNAVAALQSLQAQYNKPLIFTEIGYVSAAGTNEVPYSSAAAGAAYDPTEQQNCYEAFFEVFSQQTAWMKGVFWWQWNVSPPGSNDTGYTPQNKAAATVTLPKWFGSTTPGFTLAPSSAILALTAGSSASATISVTDQGGFTGAVSLAAAGLPSGVSASVTAGAVTGTQILTLTANNAVPSTQVSITVQGTSGALTASTALTLSIQALPSQTITFNNPGAQTIGASLTLTASATSGLAVTFASATPAVCTVSGTTATFVAAGTCTINANQAGSSSFAPAPQVAQSFTVNPLPGLSLSAAAPTLSVTPGATTSDSITLAGSGGFTGVVSLSAVIASAPAGAQNLPVLSFGSTSPVTLTVAGSGTATLTVSTTAATTALLAPPAPGGVRWRAAERVALACLVLLGFPSRRRTRTLRAKLGLLGVLLAIGFGLSGCSGAQPAATVRSGTTAGTYAITVTASSGTTTATLPISLAVQ